MSYVGASDIGGRRSEGLESECERAKATADSDKGDIRDRDCLLKLDPVEEVRSSEHLDPDAVDYCNLKEVNERPPPQSSSFGGVEFEIILWRKVISG